MLFLNTTPDFSRLGYEFHSSTWAIPGVISGHKRGTDAQTLTVLSTCSPVTRLHRFLCHQANMACLSYVPLNLVTISTRLP